MVLVLVIALLGKTDWSSGGPAMSDTFRYKQNEDKYFEKNALLEVFTLKNFPDSGAYKM